jgi:hypothetical protein
MVSSCIITLLLCSAFSRGWAGKVVKDSGICPSARPEKHVDWCWTMSSCITAYVSAMASSRYSITNNGQTRSRHVPYPLSLGLCIVVSYFISSLCSVL